MLCTYLFYFFFGGCLMQAFVLKYLLFFPEELGKVAQNTSQTLASRRLSNSQLVASNNFPSFTEDAKARWLIFHGNLYVCLILVRSIVDLLMHFGIRLLHTHARGLNFNRYKPINWWNFTFMPDWHFVVASLFLLQVLFLFNHFIIGILLGV